MIEYRHYRNSDPPQILTLWNQSGLARGGATGIPHDLLDQLLFAQPYFDRRGLILACEDDRFENIPSKPAARSALAIESTTWPPSIMT